MVPKPELHITKVLIPVTQLPSVLQDYVAKHLFFCIVRLIMLTFVCFFFVCQGVLDSDSIWQEIKGGIFFVA